ncbi:hypothetical protein EZV73_06105 [Acidaminobacter sp. JC074]|uniref:protein kinase domain-containing protein n=1 Tax=Acidaminobacter sp. JC074 TaxID=2530199 RepID=UPI001F0ECE97|nr:protein kinase [Acidaminobacter sp. JC074]MCH4887133.1 hypothetical protein [Acidaminobacter sp. JC074]
MFHLEELLKMKPTVEAIENLSALENGRIGETAYVIEKTIHRSNDCFVYYGRNSVTKQRIVIKEFFPMIDFSYMGVSIRLERDGTIVKLVDEAVESIRVLSNLKKYYKESSLMMKRMSSKYVVNVLDVFECNETVYTIMEYVPYPNLKQFIEYKKLYPNQAKSLFEMILHGVEQLHSKGCVVKTLSPSSIYIAENHVIVGDFNGLKRSYFVSQNDDDIYIAPEVTSGGILTETTDCYSLGKVLEYLLGHAEFYTTTIHKKMQPDRLSYLIKKAAERNPLDRVQNITEFNNLLNHKVVDKSKTFDVLKTFLAILLVMVAIFMVRKSGIIDMIPKPVKEADAVAETTYTSDFKMITKRSSFEFNEKKVIRWVDCESSCNFNIVLQGNDVDYRLVTHITAIDLTGFCLNPGSYKLHISNDASEVLTYEFYITKDSKFADESPEISLRNYAFYESEDKSISWENRGLVRVVMLELGSLEIIRDMYTEHVSLDLGKSLPKGDYMVSVQKKVDDLNSAFSHVYVKIYSDDELKAPVLKMEDDFVFSKNDLIEWQPFEGGMIHIRLVHEDGSFAAFEASAETGYIQLDETLLNGQYEIFATHILNDRSSHIVNKSILFEN